MTSEKLSCPLGLFGLKSFHMGLLFSLDGRMEPIACLLFYLVIKMEVLSFCERPYQTWQTAVKTFKKVKMLQQEHTRVKYYYIDFLMNKHSSLPPPSPTPFFEGGNEISKNLGRGSKFLKTLYGRKVGRTKEEVEEIQWRKVEEMQRS